MVSIFVPAMIILCTTHMRGMYLAHARLLTLIMLRGVFHAFSLPSHGVQLASSTLTLIYDLGRCPRVQVTNFMPLPLSGFPCLSPRQRKKQRLKGWEWGMGVGSSLWLGLRVDDFSASVISPDKPLL